MKTKLFFTQIKKNFSQAKPKIIKIKYQDLIQINKTKNFASMSKEIEQAYGVEGLGLMVIQDIPNHYEEKLKLLKLTQKLTSLPPSILKKIEKPEEFYAIGWSHGKEKFNGKPDYMKGSFYAKLKVYNELIGKSTSNTPTGNAWLNDDFPELKTNFYNIGNQLREISFLITDCVDYYIKSLLPSYNVNFKEDITKVSEHNMGRLLHYFPRGEQKLSSEDQWCGWHNDHGGITGLCSALYFNPKGEVVNDQLTLDKTGLWIQGRDGEYHKAGYGKNDVAFQIGETYQILSGGRLHATPHAVIISDDVPKDVHRSTYAMFLGPSKSYKLWIPKESEIKDVRTSEIYNVPKIQNRFLKNGSSFEEFDRNTISAFALE